MHKILLSNLQLKNVLIGLLVITGSSNSNYSSIYMQVMSVIGKTIKILFMANVQPGNTS